MRNTGIVAAFVIVVAVGGCRSAEPAAPNAETTLARASMNQGDVESAKEHLLAAKAVAVAGSDDAAFIDAKLVECDTMIRATAAQKLKQQAHIAAGENRWNDALKLVDEIDRNYKDETIRKAIGFDLLQARTVKGRDLYFERAVAIDVFKVMDELIEAKAREHLSLQEGRERRRAHPAGFGTFAVARDWENRELPAQLWESVAADNGLNRDELEKYWKERSLKTTCKAQYGTGSFIVSGKGLSDADGTKPPRPFTEEEWWEKVGPSDRTHWLIASFVETSGMFEVLRVDATECSSCGGRGEVAGMSANGAEFRSVCLQCSGIGAFRSVTYR